MRSNHGQPPDDPGRILVVLPTWVGDFVMSTPALRALRTRFADALITFLAVPNLVDLIEPGTWMDRVITWPVGSRGKGLAGLIRLARRLRKERFDLAVMLPNSFRSAMVVRLAGARRRIGYARDGRGWLLTDRLVVPRVGGRIMPHPMCTYYGRIAEALGCENPGDALDLSTHEACDAAVGDRLGLLGIRDGQPLVVISPGASFGASKLWLPERFAELADRLIDRLGAAVLITCGPGEEGIARRIAGPMKWAGLVLDQPRLTLGELKALIRRADLLICTDAGPRHIAKAFGIPVVTLFGPTHQAWTDTRYPLERKVSVPVDCGPCQRKVCPFEHHRCMTDISVDMVWDRCVELLERRAVGASS